MTKKVNHNDLTKILFIIYFVLLVWSVLFKLQFSVEDIPRFRSLNLVPLEGTAIINGQYDYVELGVNVLLFVPFGLFLSQIKPNWHPIIRASIVMLVSFIFESCQYIFSIGGTDITDLIGNTMGGIIGILVYAILARIFKDRTHKLVNCTGLIGTIIAIVTIFILWLT